MKITYNFGQEFELKEIDMDRRYLIFETSDGFNLFENNEYVKENGKVTFTIEFDDIKELDNIVYLLWKYLKEERLIYLED